MEILTREYEKERPKPDLRCNLSHFVIDTEESSIVSSEHVLQDYSDQDISCNLSSSSSTEELYQASLGEEDFTSLLKSQTLGDIMVDFCLQTCTSQVNIFAPLTKKQAIRNSQAAEWLAAEQKEIESIKINKVLRAAQLPKGKKLLKLSGFIRLNMVQHALLRLIKRD